MKIRKPKRDLDERHKLLAENPEDTLQALIAVNPEASPELSDEDLRNVVRRDEADQEP